MKWNSKVEINEGLIC